MKLTRRHTLKLAGAALATPAIAQFASAQTWPSRNIRAIIPFTAGSRLDIVGRIVMDPLATALGADRRREPRRRGRLDRHGAGRQGRA